MSEDTLSRYHTPDKTTIIRGEAESGIKEDWEIVFNPEEEGEEIERKSGYNPPMLRIPGGGEGAVEQLFSHPDSVDPELKLLFSDFLSDVYDIPGKDDLSNFAGEELSRLRLRQMQFNQTGVIMGEAEKKESDWVVDRIEKIDFMLKAGYDRQLQRNFVKWINAPEDEKVEYDFQYIPETILSRLRTRELRKETVKLTPDLKKIKLKNRRLTEGVEIDMKAWLNAWADPEGGLKAIGIMFKNGTVKSVALKSQRYGVTPVPFIPWCQALGGERFLEKRSGVTTVGIDFGKAHIIAPGIGQDVIKQTLRTLEINGVSRPNIPVAFFWAKEKNPISLL